MFRRKTRNSTAYTGVGLSSPAAQQPNNNAMAAALTIGQNLKQTQPNVYGNSNATVTRTPSQKPSHTSSLLKRNSSYQGSVPATSTPRQSRANSNISRRHSMTPQPQVQEYHIDDSFTDASFDQMGRDADNHYSNAARVSDLKLHHVAPKAQPKMVKKYIPTPNGIQIVEVPAETMKNEIARSNSIRSGMSLGRTGSLQNGPRANSLSGAKRSAKKSASRLSSISSQPRIDENTVFDAHIHSLDSSRAKNDLQHQIEHENQLARDLESQREELMKLKELRLKNERKMRELQALQEEEVSQSQEANASTKDSENQNPMQGKDTQDQDFMESNDYAFSQPVPDVAPKPLGAAVVAESDDDEEDVPVAPVPFVVDEMESKQLNEARKNSVISSELADSDVISRSSSRDSFNKVPITTSPHDAVVNGYGDTFIPFEESNNATRTETDGDFGIEEIPKEHFESPEIPAVSEFPASSNHLAPPASDAIPHESPSPSFVPVPEIIDELVPPTNIAGSIRSFSSIDSKSRPIKSAMKGSKSKYNSSTTPESPANKAYLSLTTAENTRLNSKLSSSQLQDFKTQQELKAQNSRSSMVQPSHQTLRKQPSGNTGNQQSGLSGRSLRPQSMAESPSMRGGHGGGMSSRSFKTQSTVQPFPQHNFHQSSSKQRAADLYAKANSRPTSEFQQLQRKSSFTREGPEVSAPTPTKRSHRTTLREAPGPNFGASSGAANGASDTRPDIRSSDGRYPPPSAPAAKPVSQARSQSQNSGQGFKSRYADSDDESFTQNNRFNSRFKDSDDETSAVHVPIAQSAVEPQHKTMRESKHANDKKEKSKEKQPKKKFLKKLFGRN